MDKLLLLFFLTFTSLGIANAGYTTNYQVAPGSIVWKGQKHWGSTGYLEISGYSDYHVGYRLNVPHYGQPTNNTCGATSLSMIDSYEDLKNSGVLPPQPDILGLYDVLNTNGSSGLTANELKAGIVALGVFGGKFVEDSGDDIDTAVKDNYWSYSPLIIYGNSFFGSAGGHYYTATGAIYCNDTLVQYDKCSYRGLYLNDSIMDSPAYPLPEPPNLEGLSWFARLLKMLEYAKERYASVGVHALVPSRFYTLSELDTYWEKTGSAIPWEKRHYYIRFDGF